MANERLRAAIIDAGLDVDAVADQLGVDAKTIERWISGRTPHPRNRAKLARLLSVPPHDLWPQEQTDSEPDPEPPDDALDCPPLDSVNVYLGSNDPRAPDRRTLLTEAQEHVDILGLTLTDLITSREIVDVIAHRADAGCEVRIALAAPDSIQLVVADQERRPHTQLTDPPALAWEVERTLGRLQPLLALPSVAVRAHVAAHINAVLRIDDELFVALHLYSAGPAREPIMHVTKRNRADLFESFSQHFEQIWHNASQPVKPDSELYPDPDEVPDRYRPLSPDRSRWKVFGHVAPE